MIEPEITERVKLAGYNCTEGYVQAMVRQTARMAAVIRSFDERLHARPFTDADARAFISANDSLVNCLCSLGGTAVLEGSLADDIAGAAVMTARELFPSLLPGYLQP